MNGFSESALVVGAEAIAIIACEIAGSAQRRVGWVKVDEVARSSGAGNSGEVAHSQLDALQGLRGQAQTLLIADSGVAVPAKGHVEFAFLVFAIETIVAGTVEEYEPGRPLDRRELGRVLGADPIVIIPIVVVHL